MPDRLVAFAEGAVAMLIWSLTFVLVKLAMPYIGPLTINGLRFLMGGLLLLPLALRSRGEFEPGVWKKLLLLGLYTFVLGNGFLQFSLNYLPATAASLLLSMIPIPTLVAGILILGEIPTRLQLAGIIAALAGSVLFFIPGWTPADLVGLSLAVAGVIFLALGGVQTRGIARQGKVSSLILTAMPMLAGGGALFLIGILTETPPVASPTLFWAALLLGLFNSALAYLIFNHAYRILAAFELGALSSLAPIGTAIAAGFLLSERLAPIQFLGILVAIGGVGLVHWGYRSRAVKPLEETVYRKT